MGAVATKPRERIGEGFHGSGSAPWLQYGGTLFGDDPQHAPVEPSYGHVMLGQERFNALPSPVRANGGPFDGDIPPALQRKLSNSNERFPNFYETTRHVCES